MSSPDFPASLKFNRLSYGANILLHLRQRQDLNIGHIGETLHPIMAAYRTVLPESLDTFYDLLGGVLMHLERYAALAESCSKSGAYQDRRQEQLNVVLQMIVAVEKDKDTMKYLASMRRQ